MYDILVYVFENCQQAELAYDRERVAKKLSAAGFGDSDISEALHWLAGMRRAPQGVEPALPDSRTTFRAFAPRELAKLVESAEDVLSELSGYRQSGYASTTAAAASDATGLLAHMGHDPVDIDALCARAGLSAEQVSSELLRLELEGSVAALPGGLYQRLAQGGPGRTVE